MILDGLKTYALQALAVCLGISLLALAVVWLQARALQAENETIGLVNANLRESLAHTEQQLAIARKDIERLDGILLERDNSRSAISRQFEGLRRDLKQAFSVADQQVRDCLAVRLPTAIADRLRARPRDGDGDAVRPPAGDAGAGLPGTGPGN